MVELTKIQKTSIAIIIIFILIVIGIFLSKQTKQPDYSAVSLEETENHNIIPEENIIIHITGYVEKEGIVELKKGARIADAIEAAGGATADADLGKVNLAYMVKDGQKIYIPSILEEEEEKEYVTEKSGDNVIVKEETENKTEGGSSMVNINTATQTELETLPGIGPSTASKITEYRKQNGEFKSIEEIKEVNGIGDSKYEKIKEYIDV